MFCRNCGVQNDKNDKFCYKCGAKLTKEPEKDVEDVDSYDIQEDTIVNIDYFTVPNEEEHSDNSSQVDVIDSIFSEVQSYSMEEPQNDKVETSDIAESKEVPDKVNLDELFAEEDLDRKKHKRAKDQRKTPRRKFSEDDFILSFEEKNEETADKSDNSEDKANKIIIDSSYKKNDVKRRGSGVFVIFTTLFAFFSIAAGGCEALAYKLDLQDPPADTELLTLYLNLGVYAFVALLLILYCSTKDKVTGYIMGIATVGILIADNIFQGFYTIKDEIVNGLLGSGSLVSKYNNLILILAFTFMYIFYILSAIKGMFGLKKIVTVSTYVGYFSILLLAISSALQIRNGDADFVLEMIPPMLYMMLFILAFIFANIARKRNEE